MRSDLYWPANKASRAAAAGKVETAPARAYHRERRPRDKEFIRAMQNDPLSHGLWEMTAPPAPPTSPLDGEVRADVAVVGCGYTGLSTALQFG